VAATSSGRAGARQQGTQTPLPEVASASRTAKVRVAKAAKTATQSPPPAQEQTPTANWNRAFATLSQADPSDVQKIAASQIEMLRGFYTEVIDQSKQSFRLALHGALIGLSFFIVAIAVLLLRAPQSSEVAVVSALAGGIVQVFSGMLFAMFRSARQQLSRYHERLDLTQRYLLANSICASMPDPQQTEVRAELVRTIARCAAEHEPPGGGAPA
jgi:TRADD-N domain-containing protein